MNKDWIELKSEEQLQDWIEQSHKKPVLLFKHSTACGTSYSALHRIENHIEELSANYHLVILDLLNYRSISNAIAHQFGVTHQSPQILIIKNGEVIQHASHYGIQPKNLI